MDLNAESWVPFLQHFRKCLPSDIQLVVKAHPRGKPNEGMEASIKDLPNTVMVSAKGDLRTLILNASGVAGVNSTVLYESRLMFRKPTYVYGRSWFTNHVDLFAPMRLGEPRPLPRCDWLETPEAMHTERLDDYANWFLAQLLARQISRDVAEHKPDEFKRKVERLSYASFMKYGPEIFEDSAE